MPDFLITSSVVDDLRSTGIWNSRKLHSFQQQWHLRTHVKYVVFLFFFLGCFTYVMYFLNYNSCYFTLKSVDAGRSWRNWLMTCVLGFFSEGKSHPDHRGQFGHRCRNQPPVRQARSSVGSERPRRGQSSKNCQTVHAVWSCGGIKNKRTLARSRITQFYVLAQIKAIVVQIKAKRGSNIW